MERIEFLKQRLNAAQAAMNAVFDRADGRWETQVYSDGPAWNVRQVAIHLAETERGLFGQMRSIVEAGASTVPDDFDIDRYNQRSVEKRGHMTIGEARAVQQAERSALLAWLETLSATDLEKTGRHPAIGIIPIDMYVRVIARHQKDHTADIAAALDIKPETGANRL